MRLTRWAVVTGALLSLSAAATFAGCGSSNNTGGNNNGDGGDSGGDSTSSSSSGSSSGRGSSSGSGSSSGAGDTGAGDSSKMDGGTASDANNVPDGFFGGDGSMCITLGSGCTSNGECCTNYCSGNICAAPPCTSIGGACTSGSQCCSFSCGTGGTCEQIGGNTCLPLGNSCGADAGAGACCSGNCALGVCQPSSWCGQQGDICQSGANCCSGVCTIPSGGSIGTCSGYTGTGNCSASDGMLCIPQSFTDGGCGGNCCSRACAPWGPTGVNVCQPATGCHVEGDTCTSDTECCGSQAFTDAGIPTSGNPVTCVNGLCTQHMGCTPAGDVCKLMTTTCNANQDCCSGLGNKNTTCRQDNVGVPRCALQQCDDGGGACATSADCCNGNPCVPHADGGSPPYVCYTTSCVPSCGGCSTSADCCPGYSCINGTCDPCGGTNPDGGTTGDGGPSDGGIIQEAGSCAQFGQLCGGDGGLACCAGLICLAGRCELN